jgi:hypothetical protein
MDPYEIVEKDSGKSVGWACGVCRMLDTHAMFGHAEGAALRAATECCDKRCEDCGVKIEIRGYTVCKSCRANREVEKEAQAFEKAKKVSLSEYDGEFVYIDGAYNEGYITPDEVEEYVRYELPEGVTPPTYAWGIVKERAEYDVAEHVREYVFNNHHEDAEDWIDDTLLDAAQTIVNVALKDVASYHYDHQVAVLLPSYEPEEDGESSSTLDTSTAST